MNKEELLKVTTAIRTGEFQIVLQDLVDSKRNKILIYNGNSAILPNQKPIIYLVEK